jgi:hypothetical protein
MPWEMSELRSLLVSQHVFVTPNLAPMYGVDPSVLLDVALKSLANQFVRRRIPSYLTDTTSSMSDIMASFKPKNTHTSSKLYRRCGIVFSSTGETNIQVYT